MARLHLPDLAVGESRHIGEGTLRVVNANYLIDALHPEGWFAWTDGARVFVCKEDEPNLAPTEVELLDSLERDGRGSEPLVLSVCWHCDSGNKF